MEHAGPQALAELTDLVEAIRANPEVKEPQPGYFYCKGRALAHFHVDSSGLYADARIGKKWSRVRVSAPNERAEFLAMLEVEIRARR
jgi:hypothetical protein